MMNNLTRTLRIGAGLMLGFLVFGCIRNDIPYPYQFGDILSIEVAGQEGVPQIDHQAQTVVFTFNDSVDVSRVELLSYELSEGASLRSGEADFLNLSDTLIWVLETYPGQQYRWKLAAQMQWDFAFRVENQCGDTYLDEQTHEIRIQVPATQPLDSICVLEAKLGLKGSVVEPDPYQVRDFTEPQVFTVTDGESVVTWTVYITQLAGDGEVSLQVKDVFAKRAHLEAVAQGTGELVFEYRRSDVDEWMTLAGSTTDDVQYVAQIRDLLPETEYVVRARKMNVVSEEVVFRTESAAQVPNLNFDQWVKSGAAWYANASMDAADFWWDSGNSGTALIGKTPTQPESDFLAVSGEGKQAARLESTSLLGIFIGGNLFTGEYLRTIGLSGGEVAMGRPFTSRPDRMTGYYCYEPKTISKAKGDYADLKGEMDQCLIYVLLADWDAPYIVNTVDGPMMDFNDPGIIAFGELVSSESTGGVYRPFDISLTYRSDRTPKYIVISAVASRYADYFTGGEGSLLYVDEFELHYD